MAVSPIRTSNFRALFSTKTKWMDEDKESQPLTSKRQIKKMRSAKETGVGYLSESHPSFFSHKPLSIFLFAFSFSAFTTNTTRSNDGEQRSSCLSCFIPFHYCFFASSYSCYCSSHSFPLFSLLSRLTLDSVISWSWLCFCLVNHWPPSLSSSQYPCSCPLLIFSCIRFLSR